MVFVVKLKFDSRILLSFLAMCTPPCMTWWGIPIWLPIYVCRCDHHRHYYHHHHHHLHHHHHRAESRSDPLPHRNRISTSAAASDVLPMSAFYLSLLNLCGCTCQAYHPSFYLWAMLHMYTTSVCLAYTYLSTGWITAVMTGIFSHMLQRVDR